MIIVKFSTRFQSIASEQALALFMQSCCFIDNVQRGESLSLSFNQILYVLIENKHMQDNSEAMITPT
jgi:hypothetical protein